MAKTNKKGAETTSSLGSLILAIIAFGIIIAIIVFFVNRGTEITDINACRTSVIARANLGQMAQDYLGTPEPKKMVPLVCKTKDEKTLSGTREEIKERISFLSAQCWYQFNQGRDKDIFGTEWGEKSCFICYYFKIPSGMDQGRPSEINIFEGEDYDISNRPQNIISAPELYNYMAGAANNLPILIGGQPAEYVGNAYNFDFTGFHNENPTKIRIRDITTAPLQDHVMDYSGNIPLETREKISKEGLELIQANKANLLVIAAEQLESNDKRAARRIMENINLHSYERQNGILVLVDFNNKVVRVHMGGEFSYELQDHQIGLMIEEKFGKVNSREQFMSALVDLVRDIRVNLIEGDVAQLSMAKPDSYYAYISNYESTFPIITSITADSTHVIAYMSSAPERDSFIKRALGVAGEYIGDIGLPGTIVPTIIRIRKGQFLVDPRNIVSEWRGDTGEFMNNIIIVPANEIREYCITDK